MFFFHKLKVLFVLTFSDQNNEYKIRETERTWVNKSISSLGVRLRKIICIKL